MGTGGTDPLDWVWHWDGMRLQWCVRSGAVVHKVGEEPAAGMAQLKEVLLALKSKGMTGDSVTWAKRHADFALAPGWVDTASAGDVFRLQMGGHPGGVQVHRSEGGGEDWALIEAADVELEDWVCGLWPQAVRKSGAFACLEGWGRVARMAGRGGVRVFWDLAPDRALGSVWKGGELRWALAGGAQVPDDLLYLTVNALHRQGLPVEGTEVVWSGEVAQGDAMWEGVGRFFAPMSLLVPDEQVHRMAEPDLRLHRWWGLLNLGV
ncbi:MAG: hypothetical protein RJA19_1050 [Bacteroidota bacterium]